MTTLWLLVSPIGEIFAVIDLPQWCRENVALFAPASPEEAERAFRAISGDMVNGRTAYPEWRRWRLLEPARDLAPLIDALPPLSFKSRPASRFYRGEIVKPGKAKGAAGAAGEPFALRSPEGKVYLGTSLNRWCKDNAGLFKPTSPRTAAVSLARAKRERKTWRGWAIAETRKDLDAI